MGRALLPPVRPYTPVWRPVLGGYAALGWLWSARQADHFPGTPGSLDLSRDVREGEAWGREAAGATGQGREAGQGEGGGGGEEEAGATLPSHGLERGQEGVG